MGVAVMIARLERTGGALQLHTGCRRAQIAPPRADGASDFDYDSRGFTRRYALKGYYVPFGCESRAECY